MDLKKCYSAFKKCNEIGKKMTSSSLYVLVNGMIIAYQNTFDKDDKEDYVAYGVNISFIDEKFCKDLDALCYIPILVNGTDVYRMDKEYDFDRFEINDDYLFLVYKGLQVDESDFTNDFIELAKSKGFNESHIKDEILCNFANDIDLYELYLNYKKTYQPTEKHREFKIQCEILKSENNIIKKSNEITNQLLNTEFIMEKEIDDNIYQRIINSGKPTTLKFKDDNENEIFKLRMMKSLFKTASATSKISVKLCKNEDDDFYYVLLNIINKGFHTVIIYRAIDF